MFQKYYLHAVGAWCSVLFAILSFPALAGSQELQDSVAKEMRLENVVVTGSRVQSKVTSSSAVQVLDKEALTNHGLKNVGDAVKRLAGVSVRDYGGIGGLQTVSVRNLGAAHTAVSYDGVVISNCQAGQVDVGRFSIDNLSSLSLSVGQNDDMLQSARMYASAGVLNISTEKPYYEDGKKTNTLIKVKGGSFGYISPYIRHWQKIGASTDLSADFNYQRADGNYPFKLKNGKYLTEEKRSNSDIESYQGEINFYHSFKESDKLSVKANYYNSERGLPGAVILYNNEADERLWDRNLFAQARYTTQFSPKWALQAQAKYNYSWNRYVDYGVEYVGGKQTDINRQNEYYLSVSAMYRPIEQFSLSLAQDGAVNDLHTNGVNSPEPIRFTSLTALTARFQTDAVKLTGTLLATYITEDVNHGNTPDDRKRLSPMLSVSYRPWQMQNIYLRAMYKNTFRVPTFTDLYYLRVGNTSLRPEIANEYSAGVAFTGKPFGFIDYLTVTLDGYFNDVKDKIIAFPSTYVWKMQNYGKVHIAGVDFTLAMAISLCEKVKFNLSGNYSWQRAIDVTNKEAKNYKHQLPYTPDHSGNVMATIENPWVNVGYTLNAVGNRYYLAQNIPQNKIDGYVEHGVTAWHEFKMKKISVKLQAEMSNLANTQYEVIKYYPMPGRAWRLMATLKF